MILTVTLNLALDVTYTVPELLRHSSHRVAGAAQRAGGKGVNVARVLSGLGHTVLATGLCGGATGQVVLADLGSLPHDFEPITGETRRSVAVVDGDATIFNEPGPQVTPAEWLAFQRRFTALAARAQVVVLSGSLPQGLPADSYAILTDLARTAGAKVLLDTSGPALTAGLRAAPDLVKPNAAELAEVSSPRGAVPEGWPVGSALVVSRGADGMTMTAAGRAWEAVPPEVLSGNPTGAGDAAAAAFAVALRDATPWPEALADAVALSGAAVVTPVGGEVDLSVHARLRPQVIVKEAPCHW
jgi:tagatose 6-phosphate kinase